MFASFTIGIQKETTVDKYLSSCTKSDIRIDKLENRVLNCIFLNFRLSLPLNSLEYTH